MNVPVPTSREEAVPLWLHLVYGHDGDHPQTRLAVRFLNEHAALIQGDLYVACAMGDVEAVRRAIDHRLEMPRLRDAAGPDAVNRRDAFHPGAGP
jgi:hypothetical protein